MMRRVLVLLAILSMIALPVNAYNIMNSYSTSNITTTRAFQDILFDSSITRTNVTYIHYTFPCLYTADRWKNGFSYTGVLAAGDNLGTFTMIYSNSLATKNVWDVCEFDLDLSPAIPGTQTSTLKFAGNLTPFFTGNTISGRQVNATDDNPSVPWALFRNNIYPIAGNYIIYSGSPVPTADFIGTPLSGNAPQLITLVTNSTGSGLSYNWSGSGPGAMLWGDLSTSTTSLYLPSEGNYTITHCVENIYGSDCEMKPEYISISNASNTTITTQFIAIDAVSGYSISNASISLQDIQNNSWTNTSSTTSMGKAYITTLIGHTINAYASAAGFKDNDLLGVPAIAAPGGHIILMDPSGYYNVSPGWITLHVKVQDESTSNPISGASVSVGKSNGMAELWQTTNAAGIATFPVENQTDFVVRASASGYTAASKGVNTGNGNGGDASVPVNIFLSKATVTPVVTMTAGPGGTVPVTQDPYLSLSPEEKQSALATDVMNYGPMLVNFFILLTIVGGFKMITK